MTEEGRCHMEVARKVWSVILGSILIVTSAGCGTPWAIRKDWKTRSVTTIQGMEPAVETPSYATAEEFDCKIDGTRLKKVFLKKPGNTYHGARETVAWYCPKDEIYWVFYQEGMGGGLKVQWFGPFEIPVKKQKHEARDKKQDKD